MESNERELIQQSLATNFELRKLYDQHMKFETRLEKLGKQAYLTQGEESEQKSLKRMKLIGVERMIKLASDEDTPVAA